MRAMFFIPFAEHVKLGDLKTVTVQDGRTLEIQVESIVSTGSEKEIDGPVVAIRTGGKYEYREKEVDMSQVWQ